MPTARAADAPSVHPDFGPNLPTLLRRRFGIREHVTIGAALLLAAAVTAALVISLVTGPALIVYRAGPTFNLQYSTDVLHRVAPRGLELVRLEAHKGKLSASITVSRLHLPPYGGNVTSGLLPVYMDGYEERLRDGLDRFRQRDEGSARVNDAQGYQIGFRAGPPGNFTWGRDMLLVPGDESVQDGVVLRLRQTKAGTFTKRDAEVLDDVKQAFRSFNFGTDRGKW
jgi:hypothetical protein